MAWSGADPELDGPRTQNVVDLNKNSGKQHTARAAQFLGPTSWYPCPQVWARPAAARHPNPPTQEHRSQHQHGTRVRKEAGQRASSKQRPPRRAKLWQAVIRVSDVVMRASDVVMRASDVVMLMSNVGHARVRRGHADVRRWLCQRPRVVMRPSNVGHALGALLFSARVRYCGGAGNGGAGVGGAGNGGAGGGTASCGPRPAPR